MNAEPTTEPRTPSEIFRLLSEDFRRRVVKRALKHRSESKALRRQRGAALRRLRVDGYRDASRAPRPKLLQPVLEAIEYHDRDLARAVLNAWVDSHAALRDRTAEHLASRGMPVPEPPDARFDSFWTREQWRGEREALAAVDGPVDPDSAGLMLCLLARRFPAPPPLASPLFEGWLDILQDLPPNAPEWEEADALIKWMEDLRREKERELLGWCREQIAGFCGSLRERFGEELRYLGIDPDPWPGLVESRPALTGAALPFLIFLEVSFEAYEPIRPQAPSRDEELERSVQRGECEDAILRAVEAWQERVAQPDPSDEDISGIEADAVEAGAAPGAADGAGAETEPGSGAPSDEDDAVLRELAALRRARERLEEDNRALRAEKAQRDDEAGRLRGGGVEKPEHGGALAARLHRGAQAGPGARRRTGGRRAGAERSRRNRPSAGDVPRQAAHQAQLPLQRGHALREPPGGARRAGVARHGVPERPDRSNRGNLPGLVLQVEPVRLHDGTVP